MPYFDSRKLARRATNYLLLGLSLPTVIDLNSSNALEFLRSPIGLSIGARGPGEIAISVAAEIIAESRGA